MRRMRGRRMATASPIRTVYPRCNSWYVGANVPRKPRVLMPLIGFAAYVDKCQAVPARGYEDFALA